MKYYSDAALAKCTAWTWGQRAPSPREVEKAATSRVFYSGAHTEEENKKLVCLVYPRLIVHCNWCLQYKYKVRASVLCAEANQIQQLYSELQQVYNVDAKLTDAVEQMTKECGLDK